MSEEANAIGEYESKVYNTRTSEHSSTSQIFKAPLLFPSLVISRTLLGQFSSKIPCQHSQKDPLKILCPPFSIPPLPLFPSLFLSPSASLAILQTYPICRPKASPISPQPPESSPLERPSEKQQKNPAPRAGVYTYISKKL